MGESLWLKLIGVAIVIVGLALRLRPTIVVVIAGMVTGLIDQMPLVSAGGREGILDILGRSFVNFRLMTLFVITLPAVGLMEHFGLHVRAEALVRRVRAATVGRLLIVYQLFRVIAGALGLRLGGHPTFVRPLIFPMSVAAAPETLNEKEIDRIKGADAASENYGNFYGQNLSPVSAGVLLVWGVLKSAGCEVSVWRLVLFTTPVVVASMILGCAQFLLLDRWIRRQANDRKHVIPNEERNLHSPSEPASGDSSLRSE